MNVRQGDHVCFSDPALPDSEYHPISQIRNGQASVYMGKVHQLVPLVELVEHTKVGSITYYVVDKTAKPAEPKVEPDQMYRVDFKVDGWSRIKMVPAKSVKAARRKAIAQLALEMNRTIQSLSAMVKRPPNVVKITLATH